MNENRRWNGWGNPKTDYPLPEEALGFLQQLLGQSSSLGEVSLDKVIKMVPESRVEPHALLDTGAEQRICHARGQSFPDWIAMKCGDYHCFPDAVALPENREQVIELLALAKEKQYTLIPYGGGTSVAGHINPKDDGHPIVTVDMGRMNRLLAIDKASQVATFGAGVPGPALEAQLRGQGFTLGHYPQSFELSTLGGWVASRSSGQQSVHYGRIEQLFAGGKLETFDGCLQVAPIPASSAGIDLREMIMGSEGRIGILSEIDVRISPLPEKEDFYVAFLPSWEQGKEVVKRAAQDKVPVSMLRLSNPLETFTQLRLAGHQRAISVLESYLRIRGINVTDSADGGATMLTYGVTGKSVQCRSSQRQMRRLIRQQSGAYVGSLLGKRWQHGRFRFPYLRESLWHQGYMVDTLETCTTWSNVTALMGKIERALSSALEDEGESIHVFSHLSHVYAQGSSIYTTYLFKAGDDADATLKHWQKLKHAGSLAVVENGGTISHQHGVGKDHAPYLAIEKGEYGVQCIEQICGMFDGQQQLNPGTLLDD
ncbi:FAD-binding oxidoreductase [Aestuariirhabdus sp. Z084]|uniref:FAD-binding oxidoreductase n=1 Tax=Aestuariirhabdus haliotis TaxID=2918751 RepID=UPI00201B3AFF|nr:FAD-binding oxidoreductase [Aestuariirhabdus haliotis]MCL6414737.1 FAD-binding oxidoreductase [Aestuariirhabdus haliotis]MCL6418669.1 FAD-binding oxidoreductase [Aestuariirhabdus haliotis]